MQHVSGYRCGLGLVLFISQIFNFDQFLHFYFQPDNLCSCHRGCRFFTIIDMVEEYTDVNATINSCAEGTELFKLNVVELVA